MVLFWTIFPALMVSVIFGHTLSPELLANFEQYLVDEYRDKITAGLISNVDEYLGGDDLRKKVADFANNFRHYASTNENIGRAKRETPAGYYGALLDSSKYIKYSSFYLYTTFVFVKKYNFSIAIRIVVFAVIIKIMDTLRLEAMRVVYWLEATFYGTSRGLTDGLPIFQARPTIRH